MFSRRLRKPTLALALLLLAALALSACGNSETKVTTGTYAGESGQNAPYLNVGPLIYEVQLSRELNPANIEDAAYLEGLTPLERALKPGEEWFAVFIQVYNHTSVAHLGASTITISDTQNNVYTPIVPDQSNQFAYRGGFIPGQQPDPGRELGRRQRGHPGRAAAVQDPGRLARQPAAEDPHRRSARRHADGLGRARRLRTRPQSRFEHFARDRCRGGAAGAVFDEEHADDDAGMQCGRERREPGVVIARFAGRARAARGVRFAGAAFAGAAFFASARARARARA